MSPQRIGGQGGRLIQDSVDRLSQVDLVTGLGVTLTAVAAFVSMAWIFDRRE